MVQHTPVQYEIHTPKFTQKFTPGSQIHETVKFARNSYEIRTNLLEFPLFRFLTAPKAFLCLFF